MVIPHLEDPIDTLIKGLLWALFGTSILGPSIFVNKLGEFDLLNVFLGHHGRLNEYGVDKGGTTIKLIQCLDCLS